MAVRPRRLLAATTVVLTAATLLAVGITSAGAAQVRQRGSGDPAAMAASPTGRTGPKGRPPLPGASPLTLSLQAATAKPITYMYAAAAQYATSDGSSASLMIAAPTLAPGDAHSLAEISVETADARQIVEVGWTVDPGLNKDARPHLFVFYWKNGVPQCYNTCGFVPDKNAAVKPGQALTAGDVQKFGIRHSGTGWKVYYGDNSFGSFPDSLWSGSFTSAGLSEWFGEVAVASNPTCTEMGTGDVPGGDAAYFGNLAFYNGPASPSLIVWATQPALYGVAQDGSRILFGGPHGLNPATDPC